MTSVKSREYLFFIFWGLLEYLTVLFLVGIVYGSASYLITNHEGMLWYITLFPLILVGVPTTLLSPVVYLLTHRIFIKKYWNGEESSKSSVSNVVYRGAFTAVVSIFTLFFVLRLTGFLFNGLSFIGDINLAIADVIAIISSLFLSVFVRFVLLKIAYLINSQSLLNYLELRN